VAFAGCYLLQNNSSRPLLSAPNKTLRIANSLPNSADYTSCPRRVSTGMWNLGSKNASLCCSACFCRRVFLIAACHLWSRDHAQRKLLPCKHCCRDWLCHAACSPVAMDRQISRSLPSLMACFARVSLVGRDNGRYPRHIGSFGQGCPFSRGTMSWAHVASLGHVPPMGVFALRRILTVLLPSQL
jgi:hypothetical protein